MQISLSSHDQVVGDIGQWVAQQCVTLTRLNKRVTNYNLDTHNMYQVMSGEQKLGVLHFHHAEWHFMKITTDIVRAKSLLADLKNVKELKGFTL